jgi:hypothetical protein
MSESAELVFLEAIERGTGEEQLVQFLKANAPTSQNLRVLSDFTQRLYHTFDCAVKKFKLAKQLDQVLGDPDVYVQNSHLSNCFRVLNQLNQLRTVDKFDRITEFKLWPVAQELEMVNAKLGALLSMEELSFPPRKLSLVSETPAEEQVEEEPSEPVLRYCPVVLDVVRAPLKGWDFYNAQHDEQIRRRQRVTQPRACIARDDETEIWRNPTPEQIDGNGWRTENAVPHVPLAEAVGPMNYPKLLRAAEKAPSTFCSFKTPKSVLPTMEQLKADKNNGPWDGSDLWLATCDARWIANARGPVRSGFQPDVHPREVFEENRPMSIEENWQPPLDGTGPKVFVVRAVKHGRYFRTVAPLAKKQDCLLRATREPPPLSVQEPFYESQRPIRDEVRPKQLQARFNTVFPNDRTRKGDTDSVTVRNLPPTFPPVLIGLQ